MNAPAHHDFRNHASRVAVVGGRSPSQPEPLQRMKLYLELLDWAESLTECGGYGQVGVGMMKTIKEKLREAYRQGRKDQSKAMRAHRANATRRVLR